MQILRDLHDEGRTVILITHDNKIAASAKRVIRIMDGKIVSDTRLNEEEKNIDQIAAQIEKEGNEE
jgi:putative ABC transport system ATP-binding protein